MLISTFANFIWYVGNDKKQKNYIMLLAAAPSLIFNITTQLKSTMLN